jgi:HAMP domain-containing protein
MEATGSVISQEAAEDAQVQVEARGSADRRQGYVVSPGFQNRFRVKLLMVALVVGVIELALSRAVAHLVENPHLLESELVPLWLAATTIALCVCVVKLCDRVSHRVAGPAHRLRRALEAVQRGERIRPIVLRKGDELQDLAGALNATLQQLDAMDEPKD